MSPSTKKFSELVAPLLADPKRRAQMEAERRLLSTALRLAELRTEAGLTHAQLAEQMGVAEDAVLRIEHADDSDLASVARYVGGLGGRLELRAVFADRSIPLNAA